MSSQTSSTDPRPTPPRIRSTDPRIILLIRAGTITAGGFAVLITSLLTLFGAADMAISPSDNEASASATIAYYIVLSILEAFTISSLWEFINYSRKTGRIWEARWATYLSALRRAGSWSEYEQESARFEAARVQEVPAVTDREVVIRVLKRATVACLIYLVLSAAVTITFGVFVLGFPDNSGQLPSDTTTPLLISFALATVYVALAVWAFSLVTRRRWAELSAERLAPRAATLADRVSAAQQKITEMGTAIRVTASEVTEVVESLHQELRARTAALEALAAEAQAAEQRADQARARAAITEDSAKAIDALLDARAAEREADSRKWDVKMVVLGVLLAIPPSVVVTIVTARLG
ncbi:hypothetical protein ABH926_003335 [Catenulispora sp. GP43]|uniref:hypothetical protein n=1 Tax=Catenulispora sp. GP43 TaxID=3156263 RepID=UPI003517F50D